MDGKLNLNSRIYRYVKSQGYSLHEWESLEIYSYPWWATIAFYWWIEFKIFQIMFHLEFGRCCLIVILPYLSLAMLDLSFARRIIVLLSPIFCFLFGLSSRFCSHFFVCFFVWFICVFCALPLTGRFMSLSVVFFCLHVGRVLFECYDRSLGCHKDKQAPSIRRLWREWMLHSRCEWMHECLTK